MHGPVRDRLESLLAGDRGIPLPDHLASCVECSSEFKAMKSQSRDIAGALRAPEPMEPFPGFYARVLQRIEESEIDSFWAFFIDSPFSKGLAAASLTVALAIGSYVISEERQEHRPPARTIAAIANNPHYDVLVAGSPDEQRDAVLENFAVHEVSLTQGSIR
jgi:hypothetical protein